MFLAFFFPSAPSQGGSYLTLQTFSRETRVFSSEIPIKKEGVAMQNLRRAAIVAFSAAVLINSAFTACSRSHQKPGGVKEKSSLEHYYATRILPKFSMASTKKSTS
jgi:hypothetical protein